MHCGKLTTFLKYFNYGHKNIKRFQTSFDGSCDILIEHLGLTREESEGFAQKYKLYKLEDEILMETVSTLKALGYENTEITKFGNILKRPSKVLREQHVALKEAGISNSSLVPLVNFRKVVNKKISDLKLAKYIPMDVNVPKRLTTYLSPKPEDFSIDDLSEDNIYTQVLSTVIKRYLQWRLEATTDEIETFFRIYKGMKSNSLEWICENIQIALDLGFTPRKLLRFGYLIMNDPSYPKTVLEKIPYLAGADLKAMMRRFPKLVNIPERHYLKTYKILKEEDIPDSTIQKQMNIFTLSPDTVKSRFEDIRNIPEMNVLRQSPRILRLIIHYNRAKSRLSFIHQLQLKCATMCLLEHDNEYYFDHHVRNTKDRNVLGDIVRLLQHLLRSDSAEIEFNLKKHPYHLKVPLVSIEKTCKYMQKSFSNTALIKVAPILLYPSGKIEDAFNQISSLTDLPVKRLTDAKKLNLALYLIEKNHHFSGDGVWENETKIEC